MNAPFSRAVALALAAVSCAATAALAQQPPPPGAPQGERPSGPMQEAARLDLAGNTAAARAAFQRLIDSAADPAARAAAQRAMAMSYAFGGDCDNTVRYEALAIAYWRSRETAEPQNAFYQEGELADEAARVCIDAGALDSAEAWYRRGYELGMKEPEPKTHPRSLWDFRLAHALGRLAARRGDAAGARAQIAAARRSLDADTAVAAQQERFFPYLTGYVALYTGDLTAAERDLRNAIAARGGQRDPFLRCLLAETLEKEGKQAEAAAAYREAYDLATAHNPPSAYARRLARAKLGASAR